MGKQKPREREMPQRAHHDPRLGVRKLLNYPPGGGFPILVVAAGQNDGPASLRQSATCYFVADAAVCPCDNCAFPLKVRHVERRPLSCHASPLMKAAVS